MTMDLSGKSGAVFAATGAIAGMVAWLVSNEASGISAQVCNVCGGQLVR